MNWKNKKVLVTGADGFIGSHLTERLITKGASVRAFVYYNSFNSWGWLDTLPADQKKKLDVFSGDVRDSSGVLEASRGTEIIFHLAALIGIPFSYHSPDSYVDTNIRGTLNVLQAARKTKPQKVIHTSTSEVYGSAQYTPMDEAHPINPQSPYAATKAAADSLALSFYRSFELPVTIIRPFNTFGPRQSARAIIPTIMAQIYSGQKTIRLGNLNALRDFNYITNTVDAFIRLAEAPKTEGEVFNVGSGREISIGELAALVSKVSGKKIKVIKDRERIRPAKSEVGQLLCNAGKIRAKCAWKPAVSLEAGIKRTAHWMKDHTRHYKPEIYNV
jgi:dTDP-glucose 4,6-dehydratase